MNLNSNNSTLQRLISQALEKMNLHKQEIIKECLMKGTYCKTGTNDQGQQVQYCGKYHRVLYSPPLCPAATIADVELVEANGKRQLQFGCARHYVIDEILRGK